MNYPQLLNLTLFAIERGEAYLRIDRGNPQPDNMKAARSFLASHGHSNPYAEQFP